MRDSLTVLAILVIGVLTAALVGPYLVDWDSHRALIERELSGAAGTPVAVTGPIDLKILPKPLLRLSGVAVGGPGARLTARSLDAELSLAALMRGQVQVLEATLVGPKLAIVQGRDGGFGLAVPSGPGAGRVAFDHLGIRDGALDLTLNDGRRVDLDDIDLDGEANGLRGPFKAAGRVGGRAFRLATGELDGGRLRVKLHLEGDDRPSVDFDGLAAPRPGDLGPGFEGTASAAGHVALDGTPAEVPWRVTARLAADRDGARATDVELRAGADLRALIASGAGALASAPGGAPPRGDLGLHGALIDLDRLAVAPAASDIAPPEGLDLVARLLRSADAALKPLALRLDLSVAFDTATLAGRTALGTAATLALGPERGAALTFRVDGPDGARLALDGRLSPAQPAPVSGPFGAAPAASSVTYRGRADLRAPDLRRTAAWLRPAAPGLADALAALPGRTLEAGGSVEASAAGLAARDLALALDGAALGGTASFTPAGASAPARLVADLSAQALALDRWPALPALAATPLDLDLSLSARAVTLAASPAGAVAAGEAALRVLRTGDDLRLDRLTVDVAGARLEAAGSRDASGARGRIHLAAPRLAPVAAALAPLLPAPAAAALRARAAALSPVDATVEAEASVVDGTLAPTRLALDGTAGRMRLGATLAPEGPAAGRDAEHRPAALTLRAEAPDGADLLRLLGFDPAGASPGAGRLSGRATGTLADGFAGSLDAALGATAVAFAGRAGPAGGAGRLALRSSDLGPSLAAAGLPAPALPLPAEGAGDVAFDDAAARWRDLSGRVGGSTVTGELSVDRQPRRGPDGAPAPTLHGRLAIDRLPLAALLAPVLGLPGASASGAPWSAAPFAPAPKAMPHGELALSVDAVTLRDGFDARGVSLTIRTAPDSLALGDVAGAVGGGRFSGALALRRDGAGTSATGHAALEGLAIDAGGLSGRLGAVGDVAGSGDSPSSLVASLAGTGTLTLSGAALPRTDPEAPRRVLAAVTARDAAAERGSTAPEPTVPDAEALRRAVGAALDAGPLVLGTAELPAVLTGGVLRAGPLRRSGSVPAAGPGAGAGWTAEAGLALDLRALTLATRADLRIAGSADGAVAVSRAGPLAGGDAPRGIDIGGLVLAVQAGAIARAQDRIDLVEQDIRERAAFNRQLKAIAQRQQLEREQAEAARQAEVARLAAEAQARAAAARAAAQAAADARRAAAEAERQAAEDRRAEAARQRAEDARLQAEVEAAARAAAARDAAARDAAEKQRFIDRALKAADPPLDAGAGLETRFRAPERRARHRDPPAPPSIIDERRAAP